MTKPLVIPVFTERGLEEIVYKIGDYVIYEGNTYTFPGWISGITEDGQLVVSATGCKNTGAYEGMKHIYGPRQIRKMTEEEIDIYKHLGEQL